MKTKNNRSQQETVGFVLIIVIVTIAGLIFLGFSINTGETTKKTSAEISDFLQASFYYTTNCTTSFIPQYKDMQDLIKSCYKNEKCLDDRMACSVLDETFKEIIKKSFLVSEESKNKAYQGNIYYSVEEMPNQGILNISEGNFNNCSSTAGASQSIFMDSGQINVDLEICYG
jgi:hypothetical protein